MILYFPVGTAFGESHGNMLKYVEYFLEAPRANRSLGDGRLTEPPSGDFSS